MDINITLHLCTEKNATVVLFFKSTVISSELPLTRLVGNIVLLVGQGPSSSLLWRYGRVQTFTEVSFGLWVT